VFAIIDRRDQFHESATRVWRSLAERQEATTTTNYVVVETFALMGRRLGLGAVRDFQTQLAPVLDVYWVDKTLHDRAVRSLLTFGSQHLSLVDCVSFEAMRELGLESVFTFDAHFAEQGFKCLP
jgi:predicted nucleic acid-binding protein